MKIIKNKAMKKFTNIQELDVTYDEKVAWSMHNTIEHTAKEEKEAMADSYVYSVLKHLRFDEIANQWTKQKKRKPNEWKALLNI